jgi:deubiquitinase DESI2
MMPSLPVEVILNVYKLGDPNDPNTAKLQMLAGIGLGLYHSGIEINGIEYAYGGDPSSSASGVFQTLPMTVMGATYY